MVRPNFNSIKVQLKRPAGNIASSIIGFQFHKGTIKTYQTAFNLFTTMISIP